MKQHVLALLVCFAVLLMFDHAPRGWTEQRVQENSVTTLVAVDNSVPMP